MIIKISFRNCVFGNKTEISDKLYYSYIRKISISQKELYELKKIVEIHISSAKILFRVRSRFDSQPS